VGFGKEKEFFEKGEKRKEKKKNTVLSTSQV
jgi:hypothetical protein